MQLYYEKREIRKVKTKQNRKKKYDNEKKYEITNLYFMCSY